MTSNRHCIQRQVVEVIVGGGIGAPAIQESFAHTFNEELVPELIAVFDRAAGAHELLRLDRLEIDLGTFEARDWQPELRRRLGVELAQKLSGYTPEHIPKSQEKGEVSSSDPLRQFLYFLRHGRLPWWGERAAAEWRKSLPPSTLDSQPLRAVLLAAPDALTRFVESFDDDLLDSAVSRWAAIPHAARLLETLTRPGVTPQQKLKWRRWFWSRTLAAGLRPGELPARGTALLRDLLAVRPGGEHPRASGEGDASSDGVAVGETAAADPMDLPPPWRDWLPEARNPSAKSPGSREKDTARSDLASRVASLADARRQPRASPPSRQDEEAVYLPGAGAILLHPFLETLFRDRGLLEGRDFHDDLARGRAVQMVGLLTFGSGEVAEYDLVTAKLLCGHSLERPIAPVALDDDDLSAADELLRAVLRHWQALKSDSSEWLRSQFFLRDGKLERVDEGYRLTVERRAQDVLLARLPWGLGVVGFPWMKSRIFVHWLD